jgi:hypothetical protein
VPVAAICVTIDADLVGSCALEDAIWVVGVAELALFLPYLTSADEIVAQGDVHQQIGLLRHADVADFEIGAAVALTREHPLVSGGETSVVTNALQRPQNTVVRAGPIGSMMEAEVDVVPGTFTTHEVPLPAAWHVRKRSEGRVVELFSPGILDPEPELQYRITKTLVVQRGRGVFFCSRTAGTGGRAFVWYLQGTHNLNE